MGLKELIFITVALLTTAPCLVVVFSRNILYSAFALFFTFLGTSGLYFFLDAEFLAITQVVVYIGGVSVLLLFALLLTRNVDVIKRTNLLSPQRMAVAAVAGAVLLASFVYAMLGVRWAQSENPGFPATSIEGLGDLLLSKYLLPFEAASILLLAVLVGSLVIARRSVR